MAPNVDKKKKRIPEASSGKSGFSLKLFGYHLNLFKGKRKNYQEYYRIAILASTRIPVIQETYQEFISQLRDKSFLNYRFTVFNAHGNSTNTRKHLEEIIEDNYDMIFSIGTQCSIMAKEVTHHRRKAIPIVFAGVWNPEFYNLVESEEFSGNNVTGVKSDDSPRYIEQLERLLEIKPEVKKVVAFYDPLSYVERKNAEDLREHFAQIGVTIELHDIINKNDLYKKAHEVIPHADAVVTLRNLVTMSCIEELTEMCNENRVILFASDLPSVERGAAIGFGVVNNTLADQSVGIALQILEHQTHPSQIPVQSANFSYSLKVNPQTMSKQGLNIDPEILFALKRREAT